MHLLPGIALAQRDGCEHCRREATRTDVVKIPTPSLDGAASPRPPFLPLWHTDPVERLSNTWEGWLPKAKRDTRVAGDLRHALALALEGSPDVREICESPYRFRIQVGETWVSGVFDFWCRTFDGEEYYFDAFYTNMLRNAEPGTRDWLTFHARCLWAEKYGLSYSICTEKTLLRYPVEIANWSMILSYLSGARDAVNRELCDRFTRCVAAKSVVSLAESTELLADVDLEEIRTSAFYELHGGRVVCDLRHSPLSTRMTFSRPSDLGSSVPAVRVP